jgi:site-specific DNA-methyltransferase (adenine-specific)
MECDGFMDKVGKAIKRMKSHSATGSTFAPYVDASSFTEHDFQEYLVSPSKRPLFIKGDALSVLQLLPSESVDCCITSPPYWGKRQYATAGIGLEKDYRDYIKVLSTIFREIKRVLKNSGSFWLNIGDSYKNKHLLGIPWRVAFELIDNQGWILRNEIIWNKVKGGPDNSKDKLGNVHEQVFHFVKIPKGYYYNVDAIRAKPHKSKVVNGAIVSATGVSGVRYKRQIELSTALTPIEKKKALEALEEMLDQVRLGKLADFRMIIRGHQRTTHSNSVKVSGRAKELQEKGFYFLKYHPNGSKPRDVWDILPEDTQKRDLHYAPFPEDLCKIPILATCPPSGIVIDPFAGTGTAMLVAMQLGRKSVGIDLSGEYLEHAARRCLTLF